MMTNIASKRTHWFLFIGFIVLSLVFHSYNLEHASYDLDEAVHIWHAQKEYAAVVEQASHDPNPPVYNLILSFWIKVFGVSEFATRFLSVLFGALGVGLLFLIASRNFGLAVGAMAALFYCFSPIQFRFTHLARPYSMLMVTVILSYGALLEVLKDSSKRKLFWYYLATTAMIYVHPTSVFNLAAQGLIVLFYNLKDYKTTIRLFVPMVGAALSFGVWMLAIPYFERNDSMWFGPPTWEQIKYVITIFYANGKLLIFQLLLLSLVIFRMVKKKESSNSLHVLIIGIWCLVPFLISIGFSHLVKPVFQDKYILSVQPAMMLLLAYSIYSVRFKLAQIGAFVLAMVFFYSSMDTTVNAEGDWKGVVEYIKPIHGSGSVVLIDPWYEFRTFSYYYDRHAYETPDSTVKILSENQIHTGWNDALDLVIQKKSGVIHLISAHQGAFDSQIDRLLLDSVATQIRDTQFIGIRVESFDFLQVLDYQLLEFTDRSKQVLSITESDAFSSALVVPFSESRRERWMQISASVDLRSSVDMEGVVFVVSVERDGDRSFVYHKIDVNEIRTNSDWFTVEDQFTISEFQKDWIVKVYVWNTGGQEFEMDNLKLEVRN